MKEEYRLPYGAEEIAERLGKVDDIPTKVSQLENDAEYLTKQDIPDLETIREGAQKGATALQEHQDISHLATKQEVEDIFPMKMVTYADLVAMRDEGRLVPGQQYRIIDFVTTVDQTDAKSAGHQFDVIVTADGPSVLNEKARAAISEGDTYFTEAGANLKAWQLWYCLDNDKSRFEWADATNGKGVIYRMIDEWQNDVPYDFKNVVYVNTEEDYAQYTFGVDRVSAADWETAEDESHTSGSTAEYNRILPYGHIQKLNAILLLGECSANTFEWGCHDICLGWESYRNSFGETCQRIHALDGIIYDNKFDTGCSDITLGGESRDNVFGFDCNNMQLGYIERCSFGKECSEISSGNACYDNMIGDRCNRISLGDKSSNNSFGKDCSNIRLGNACNNNMIGDRCYDTEFGDNSNHNAIGAASWVVFGIGCCYNKTGNECTTISLGDNCVQNTIGNKSHDITMAEGSISNTIGNNCYEITMCSEGFENNIIGDGCYNFHMEEYCYKLTFGAGCYDFSMMGCSNSSFGPECHDINLEDGSNRVFFLAGIDSYESAKMVVDCFVCPDGSSYIEIPFKDIKIS